ncbi:MAG: SagB/ThcOx family dehydrogenase [bacterium]
MPSDAPDHLPIGDRYQRSTRYYRSQGAVRAPGPAEPAEGTVELPQPQTEGGEGLWSAIAQRRSCRKFLDSPLTGDQLAQLLWATQGVTARRRGFAFRAAPSAGACYPIDTYLIVHRVERLDPGLYFYNVNDAVLEARRHGDLGPAIAAACLGQGMCERAAVVFAWVGVPARAKRRYHERAYRYLYMDAGHIGQNLHLAATALGLGCCAIGAFFDMEVNAVLGVDGDDEFAAYLSVIGVPDYQ